MKFPGQRKSKHYFPVNARDLPLLCQAEDVCLAKTHVIGIDQTMVDIEAKVEDEVIERYGLSKGHSLIITREVAESLYAELTERRAISHQFAGGTIGNTLHNYSVLADDMSILLGVMSADIRIGGHAYTYLCKTSSRMNLDYLQPVEGPIGRCFALISENGERTFALEPGLMNQLRADSVPRHVFDEASALVLTSYLLRCEEGAPLPAATMRAVEYAEAAGVPVVLTLGTKFVIDRNPAFWREFIEKHVSVVAMNEDEAKSLTGLSDPLAAADMALDWADFVLCTTGPLGLYTAGYTDDSVKRVTRHPLLPGAIPEFNRYEFSRPMRKAACENPIRVYSTIAPYMGGPAHIRNTNGAGDGALSALLHDISANIYHRANVPSSAKHAREFLTYSSFSQICKYANRVAYEVIAQHAPRLSRGLPEKEDSLEEVYWER
jgi:inosine kinase